MEKVRSFLLILHQVMQENRYGHLSTYTPTYWPTDLNKIPDLLDFFVTNGLSQRYLKIVANYDICSDHTPVIATTGTTIIEIEMP